MLSYTHLIAHNRYIKITIRKQFFDCCHNGETVDKLFESNLDSLGSWAGV